MNLIQRLAAKLFRLDRDEGPEERRGWQTSMFYGAAEFGTALTRVPVNPHTALNMATVHACVRVLSEAIAVMPLAVFERLEGGGKRRVPSHPVDRLLNLQPNPDMTPAVFKQTLMSHLLTWGNAYARIVTNGAGQAAELWPIEPNLVQIGCDTVTGKTKYQVTRKDGTTEVLDAGEVLHVPGLSHDGRHGLTPVGLLRETIGLGLGLERFAGRAIDNGAWMAYVVKHPDELDDETFDRIRATLHDKQGGIANAYRPGLLEDGMEIQQLSMPGDDAMFLNLRKFEKREVAAAYRVPPHMLADLEGGASFASIEVMSIEFARYSLGIWIAKWEQECSQKLLLNRRKYVIEFVVEALLRGDTKSRFDAYNVARIGGWMNVDEIRASENKPPLPNGAGQGYLVPLNMGVVGGPAAQPTDVNDLPAEDRSLTLHLRGAAVSAMERVVAKELERAKRYQSKGQDAVDAWATRFYANQRGSVLAILEEYAQGLALALAPPGTDPADLVTHVRAATRDVVDTDQDTALEDLKSGGTAWNGRAAATIEALVLNLRERLNPERNGTT